VLFSRSAAAEGEGQASIRDCRREVLLRRQASISCSPGDAPCGFGLEGEVWGTWGGRKYLD